MHQNRGQRPLNCAAFHDAGRRRGHRTVGRGDVVLWRDAKQGTTRHDAQRQGTGRADTSASHRWLLARGVAAGEAGLVNYHDSPGFVQVTSDATMSRSKAARPQSDPAPGFIPPGEPGLQPNHGG